VQSEERARRFSVSILLVSDCFNLKELSYNSYIHIFSGITDVAVQTDTKENTVTYLQARSPRAVGQLRGVPSVNVSMRRHPRYHHKTFISLVRTPTGPMITLRSTLPFECHLTPSLFWRRRLLLMVRITIQGALYPVY